MENINQFAKESVGEISNLIYHVRGQDVMLDRDLAKIYGYETKALNQQVKNNMEKFEGEEFMFQLTPAEVVGLRSQIVTLNDDNSLRSKNLTLKNGRGEHVKYLPYVFTEQGVYMLMTVLKGDLAVKQSRALVMAFKAMKDYIIENQNLLDQKERLKMMALVAENNQHVGKIEKEIATMDNRIEKMEEKVKNVVMRNEIAPIMLDFNKFTERQEYLFMNGELTKSKDAYQEIYSSAKKSIIIIDDYVDIRTLRLLIKVKPGVEVTIFSDNAANYLHQQDLLDFFLECPQMSIKMIKTLRAVHDRFVILDFGTDDETIYHCGASSKDAGKAVTVISKIEGSLVVRSMEMLVKALMKNPALLLK